MCVVGIGKQNWLKGDKIIETRPDQYLFYRSYQLQKLINLWNFLVVWGCWFS